MGFRDLNDRLNEAVISHLSDGTAIYHTVGGETRQNVPYELDLSYQVYAEGEDLPQSIKTVEVPVSVVPKFKMGDRIEFDGKRWELLQVVEDDGAFRRLEIK